MKANRVAGGAIAGLGLLLGAAVGPVAPAPAAAQVGDPAPVRETACRDDAPERARCHRVRVPLDRADPAAGSLDLHVLVLPAADPVDPDRALFYFAGGPGSAASRSASGIDSLLGPVGDRVDAVLMDARGTGRSHPLTCGPPADLQAYFDGVFPTEPLSECRSRLAGGPALRHFGNPEIADDADAVREALGYRTVDLFGISGGTRTAQTYLRRHPSRVRSVALDGVVPFDPPPTLDFADHARRALERVLAECGADSRCRKAYPDPGADVDSLFARVGRRPARVEVEGEDGARTRVTYDADDLGYTLRGMLYGSAAREIPALVRAALAGDPAPLAQRYLDRAQRIESGISIGAHFTIFCAEDLAGLTPADAGAWGDGTFLGDYLARTYLEACRDWPVEPGPPIEAVGFRTDVPALLLSGGNDPVTPPEYAVLVARSFSRRTHVVFPHGGHAFDGGDGACRRELIRAFASRPTAKLDTSCVERIRPDPFRGAGG